MAGTNPVALACRASERLNTRMLDPTISIRSADIADMTAVGDIVAESWRQTFLGLLPQDVLSSITPEAQKARHERTFVRDGVRYHVASKAGEVIGFASWGPGRDPIFSVGNELYAIYLRPKYERQGIGRLLFESVSADVAASGYPGFYLTALEMNPNRAFYARLGGIEADAPNILLGGTNYGQVGFVWRFAQ
tara:strand:+ start:1830 stop:2405 length:576 start_codon:yes stop_codon:yes gene_type:complete